MEVKSIGLFCAASDTIAPQYSEYARKVGTLLGKMGIELVYGGAAAGLMEATAKAAKEAGAHITGVVPQILEQRNRVSCLLEEKIVTVNLSDRKDKILERSDVLIALPGGIGTLDEIFHVMAAATIGYHSKRVILYNEGGFWDSLLALLQSYKEKNFIRGRLEDFMLVANDIDELESILRII